AVLWPGCLDLNAREPRYRLKHRSPHLDCCVHANFEVARHEKRNAIWPIPRGPRIVFVAIVYCLVAPFDMAADAQRNSAAIVFRQSTFVEGNRGVNKVFASPIG